MSKPLTPGQSFEVNGTSWLVLRVAGGRAEIKRMGLEEVAQPKPNRKARRKLWVEIKKKARTLRVDVVP